MAIKSCKLLSSKDEIKEYLGNLSDYLFNKYVDRGLPARYEDRRWIAHADNLDDFMRVYTKVSMKNKKTDENE